MSLFCLFRAATLTKHVTAEAATLLHCGNRLNVTQTRGAAKKFVPKGKGKGMAKEQLKGPEVCKDPVRLTTHAVGVNIYKVGEDPPLKPVEEYPEWLFQLNLGDVKQLNELDPETMEYWTRLRKENIWRSNKLSKGKKF